MSKKQIGVILGVLAVAAWVEPSWAAGGGGMPWDGPLDNLLNSLTSTWARAIGVTSVVIFGAAMCLSDGGAGLRAVIGILLGLTIMFSAATWALPFFGYTGGALM